MAPDLPIYTVDTNIVVNLYRRMPRDVWPTVWARVEALIAAGRCTMPRQVFEELTRVDDGCAPWAKAQPGFVRDPPDDEIAIVTAITAAHPGWVVNQTNEADPWLIAHAACRGAIAVTDERRRGPGTIDANLAIPNVAAEQGVECVDFNELARREGWAF